MSKEKRKKELRSSSSDFLNLAGGGCSSRCVAVTTCIAAGFGEDFLSQGAGIRTLCCLPCVSAIFGLRIIDLVFPFHMKKILKYMLCQWNLYSFGRKRGSGEGANFT